MRKHTKKIISFIVVLAMIATIGGVGIWTQVPAAEKPMYGDTDNDKEITATDALNVLKAVVKLSTPDEAMTQLMDVDGDSEVTATDALMILKYVVKLIDHFDVEDMELEPTENVKQTNEPVESEKPVESIEPTAPTETVESETPTVEPTVTPTESVEPTDEPVAPVESEEPTYSAEPTTEPTEQPVESTEPTVAPTEDVKPTVAPTAAPTTTPTDTPAESEKPTVEPSAAPTTAPTPTPTPTPTSKPTVNPSYKPAEKPEDVDPSRWPQWHGEGENPPKPNSVDGYLNSPNAKRPTIEDVPKELFDEPIELGRWILKNGLPLETTDVSALPCPWCASLGTGKVYWKSWEATDAEMKYHEHYFCNGCGLDFGKSDQWAGTHPTLGDTLTNPCHNYTLGIASFRGQFSKINWDYRFSLWCTTVFDDNLGDFNYGIAYPDHCHYKCTECGSRW